MPADGITGNSRRARRGARVSLVTPAREHAHERGVEVEEEREQALEEAHEPKR